MMPGLTLAVAITANRAVNAQSRPPSPKAFAIHTRLFYTFPQPTDVLLQIEAACLPDQKVKSPQLWLTPVDHFNRVPAHDEIGERIWLRAEQELALDYTTTVIVDRDTPPLSSLPETLPHRLPGAVIDYLMPSRFCPSDRFVEFAAAEFSGMSGGACVTAIQEWVSTNLSYAPGSSNAQTCASDTFIQRQGVCRDYAHLVVSLCRAMAIPARLCSVYAPDVSPPDFHAVAEVYLQGGWHLVDATGMAATADIIRIGVGRDAADVPFLSSFGGAVLVEQKVSVTRVS